jgi:hypothetical protein
MGVASAANAIEIEVESSAMRTERNLAEFQLANGLFILLSTRNEIDGGNCKE